MYTAVPLPLYLMILEVIWAEAVCSHMTDRVETCYNKLFFEPYPQPYVEEALDVQLHVLCLMKGINMKRYIRLCHT